MTGRTGTVLTVLVLMALGDAAGHATVAAAEASFPLEFLNTKSGISMSLSGENGKDWAVERTCHDDSIADQIVFLKSSVSISLAHNDRNTIVMETPKVPRLVGVNGADGKGDSTDEGDIHWKIDRDQQAHAYAGGPGAVPAFAPKYSGPFQFDSATYDGTKRVLASVGDDGGKWGATPKATTGRYCYGQVDSFGNEWHTIAYWDDDVPLLKAAGVDPHRQGASDGHCVWVCVNPRTPVLQFRATGAEQFYTTPVKTYFVPKIWEQTTYLTGGVLVSFVNLAGGEPVSYRVDGGDWKVWDCKALVAGHVFSRKNAASVLEVRCGKDGPVLRRTVVLDPEYPAPQEKHGYLLWADDAECEALAKKLHAVEPFKSSYRVFRDKYYQGAGAKFEDTRGVWRAGASEAGASLSNAMVVAIEGPEAAGAEARLAKKRLLRMARLESVGFELTIDAHSPSKDYLNELGQTLEIYGDAAVAYDILASRFRRPQHADGMTPIEELLIRDNVAKIAKTIL